MCAHPVFLDVKQTSLKNLKNNASYFMKKKKNVLCLPAFPNYVHNKQQSKDNGDATLLLWPCNMAYLEKSQAQEFTKIDVPIFLCTCFHFPKAEDSQHCQGFSHKTYLLSVALRSIVHRVATNTVSEGHRNKPTNQDHQTDFAKVAMKTLTIIFHTF